MDIEDIVDSVTVPYSAAYKEFLWWGSLFQSKRLGFNMQPQLASNWCWAATSNSVSHFYWFASTWTQCKIVNAELGRTDACNSPTPAGANVPWYLDKALARTNNFVSITAGQASFAQIRAEIDAGRPMGARIGWNGGGGHFMVIYGYSVWLGQEYVDIDDPIYGKSHITLNDFSTNYQGSGTWTHYYITKSYRRWWWPDVALPEQLFKKIWEARQSMLLTAAVDPERLDDAEPDQSRFGFAQPTYSLGLDRLLSGDVARPSQVGLRVYETVRGTPVAFYDVDDAGEGRVRAASSAGARLDAFSSAVSSTARLVAEGGKGTETRILQVPALNFEALWVLDEDGRSMVVPLLGVGDLQPGRTYALDEAIESLREAAKPLANMDDTMGA
jgi:hypothetical protein